MADLKSLTEFTKRTARLDLKTVALDYILGLSGSKDGIKTLIENVDIIFDMINLVDDTNEVVKKDALLFLVNFTAEPESVDMLCDLINKSQANCFPVVISCALDPENKYADAACMVLSNMTRVERHIETFVTEILPYLPKLLNAFTNLEYNKKGSKLHYIGPMISNLCCSRRVVNWLLNDPSLPLIKLLPFCHYKESKIRRGGAIGAIKNITFNVDLHSFLLSDEVNLLTYILHPLIGNEDYPDDEMDSFPLDLQYMPEDKVREEDPDLRKMLLETLMRLCEKRFAREILRKSGVYYILRELHKWEKDRNVLLACENVVDVLIRKESEIELDDISGVNVPDDMTEKFDKMDKEFVNEEN